MSRANLAVFERSDLRSY